MDKKATTRASDFKEALRSIADLCKKADMEDTNLIAEIVPTASMHDRANVEIAAGKLMRKCDSASPTCGEHGALVNPMKAGSDSVDVVMHQWMGKTDSEIQMDTHKVKALTNAVGIHKSPGELSNLVLISAPHSD